MSSSRSSKVISLSLAQGFMTVVTIISSMVLTRYLTKVDYATYLQTFLAYDFFVPILLLGLPSAMFYFLPDNKTNKRGLVIDNIVLLLIMGGIFSIFLIFGGANLLSKRFDNDNLLYTLKWLTFYPLYTFPVMLLGAVLITQDKVKLNAWYNVITGVILTIMIIIATISTNSYTAPILVRIFLPLIYFPIALFLILRYVPGHWRYPSVSSMLGIMKFSIPLGLATILGTISNQLSNIIVSVLCTPEDYAVYATGAREIPLVGIITSSLSMVIMSDMVKECKNQNKSAALLLFRKASTISAAFLIPSMVFLMFFAEHFIILLFSERYVESVLSFRIFLFYLPVRIVFYGSAFIALGKTKLVLYRSIVDLILTSLLCYVLTLYIGYIGAAIGTVIVSYIWGIPYNLVTLAKNFECSSLYIIPLSKIGRIFVISAVSVLLPSLLLFVHMNALMLFLLGGIIFLAIYSFMSYRYISEVNEFVSCKIMQLKSKLN